MHITGSTDKDGKKAIVLTIEGQCLTLNKYDALELSGLILDELGIRAHCEIPFPRPQVKRVTIRVQPEQNGGARNE